MFSTNVAVLILNCVLILTATVQNSLVILVIFRTSSFQTPSNVLLCSLAFTDLLAGIVVHPIFVAFKARLLCGDFECTVLLAKEVLVIYTGILSLMTLLSIIVERLIALSVHLCYRELVMIPRALAVAVAIWVSWSFAVCAWPLGLDIFAFSLLCVVIKALLSRHSIGPDLCNNFPYLT